MPMNVSGFWAGIYYYADDIGIPAVKFDAELEQNDSTISGFITEENTFDYLASGILCASIEGMVNGRSLKFEKTYTSGGAANHTIFYKGLLSGGGTEISGTWLIGDWGGSFVMRRDKGRLMTSKNDNVEILIPT